MSAARHSAGATMEDESHEPRQAARVAITRTEAQAVARFWLGDFADDYYRWRVGEQAGSRVRAVEAIAHERISELIEAGLLLRDEVACLLGEVLREKDLPWIEDEPAWA